MVCEYLKIVVSGLISIAGVILGWWLNIMSQKKNLERQRVIAEEKKRFNHKICGMNNPYV